METDCIDITAELKTTLFTAVLCDTLDSLGYRDQAMRPFVRPLDDTSVLFGPARTGLYSLVYETLEGENPSTSSKSN